MNECEWCSFSLCFFLSISLSCCKLCWMVAWLGVVVCGQIAFDGEVLCCKNTIIYTQCYLYPIILTMPLISTKVPNCFFFITIHMDTKMSVSKMNFSLHPRKWWSSIKVRKIWWSWYCTLNGSLLNITPNGNITEIWCTCGNYLHLSLVWLEPLSSVGGYCICYNTRAAEAIARWSRKWLRLCSINTCANTPFNCF